MAKGLTSNEWKKLLSIVNKMNDEQQLKLLKKLRDNQEDNTYVV